MTDAEGLALKAYLFSLPAVHATASDNTLAFPFNQRWLMVFWSTLFNADARFAPNSDQSPEWNRGAYIAEALAHCGDLPHPEESRLGARQQAAHAVRRRVDAGLRQHALRQRNSSRQQLRDGAVWQCAIRHHRP
jgi:hypothetical protein